MRQQKKGLFKSLLEKIPYLIAFNMKKTNDYIFPLLFAFSTASFSDDSILLDDFSDDFSDDLPIVISASRLNQSVLTSPSSVTVIDKAMIEASGFIEFADLLRLVPGFQVAHIDGRSYSAVYHGNGSEISNRLQVLVNGRSTYTPTLSTVEWDLLGVRLEDVERIEVVRGPSSSAYGSNSFTAAINIITKQPDLDASLQLHTRAGNKGERDQLVRHSHSSDNFSYRLTAGTRDNDGFDDRRDSRDLTHISFHGQMNKRERNPIDLYLAYTDGKTGTEENANELLQRDRDVTSWSAHLQGRQILSESQEVKWNLYHNSDDIDDLTETRLLSDLISEALGVTVTPADFEALFGTPDLRTIEGSETNDATKTDFEIEYSSSDSQNIQYVVGTGARYETLKSPSYFRERGRLSETSYRLFANSQIPLRDRLTLNSGVIYEYTNNYLGRTSPRISLNWQVVDSQSLRLSAARGYRFPSILDRNFDARTTLPNGLVLDERFNSDENLKPETITSYDIGYLGKLSSLPISWDLKLYQEEITDLISFAQDRSSNDTVGNFSRLITNGEEIESYGFEGEITYRPENDSFVKFHFNIGRSTFYELRRINPDVVRRYTDNAPEKSFGLLASKKLNSWQVNGAVYYVGDTQWFSQGGSVDSYTKVDASIDKSFQLGQNSQFNIKLAAQNINNKHEQFGNDLFVEPFYYIKLSITNF